jgi:hypothetical protein
MWPLARHCLFFPAHLCHPEAGTKSRATWNLSSMETEKFRTGGAGRALGARFPFLQSLFYAGEALRLGKEG